MSQNAYRSYVEDEVLNATPQRLRWMLIDGAIRFATNALTHWESDRAAAMTALGRCRNIVIELIGGIRADRMSCEHVVDHFQRHKMLTSAERQSEIDNLVAISRNTMSVYLIVFRQLDEAQLDWNPEKIAAAISVLEVERETAKMVCEQLPAAPILTAPQLPAEISSADAAALLSHQRAEMPHVPTPATYGRTAQSGASSMSFEA